MGVTPGEAVPAGVMCGPSSPPASGQPQPCCPIAVPAGTGDLGQCGWGWQQPRAPQCCRSVTGWWLVPSGWGTGQEQPGRSSVCSAVGAWSALPGSSDPGTWLRLKQLTRHEIVPGKVLNCAGKATGSV